MRDILNISDADRYNAQELADTAAYEADIDKCLRLCEQAARLDPYCVDALFLMACSVDDPLMRAERLRDVIQTAEDALGGIQTIMEMPDKLYNRKVFSYMAARTNFARALYKSGDLKASVDEYEIMLVIDTSDVIEAKNPLIAIYLETLNLKGADRLLNEFGEDVTGTYCWATVLERLLAGDPAGAEEALVHAGDMLPLADAYILGKRAMPREIPVDYEPGEPDEAVYCADILGNAWRKYPEHLKWLKERS
ncbi:MAG: hypothetical protein ACYC1M_13375 [Armatimonadota bacterium]